MQMRRPIISNLGTLTSLFLLMTLTGTLGQGLKHGSDVSPYCDYLLSQAGGGIYIPSIYGGSPFKIYTKSVKSEINDGTPVQVTIAPFSKTLNFFNFTDFILYAIPATAANGLELELLAGLNSPHLGVFQLFEKGRAGAGGLTCNPKSRAEDSVAAFEERLLATFKQYYPNNPMIQGYKIPARNQVSVLWWPTKEAMAHPEIKFVANIKSMGKWFKLQSTTWKVNKPLDQWAMTDRLLNQFQTFKTNMHDMERRLEQPF